MANAYEPWLESGETELSYFRRRFLEESARAERLCEWSRQAVEAVERAVDPSAIISWDFFKLQLRLHGVDLAAAPAAPPEQPGGWIRVEDQLPPPGHGVLVYTIAPEGGNGHRCVFAASHRSGEWTIFGAGGDCPVPGTITHWQESPPEPEECLDCGSAGPTRETEAEAVYAWNRRAVPAPSPAVERVLRAAEELADVIGATIYEEGMEDDLFEAVAALRASRKEPQGG